MNNTRNYCCVDCGGLIDRHAALYKSGKCRSCSQKGKSLSFETRKKISKARIGKKLSKETKHKISIAHKGKDNGRLGIKHSKESKLKMSKSKKGIKFSKEHCLKISRAITGIKRSQDTCLKIGLSKKGIILSKEHRLKIGKAHSGKNHHLFGKHQLIETKLKISQALKGKFCGDKNPRWLGGSSLLPYPFDFSKSLKNIIRCRDNHHCQGCGTIENNCDKSLDVHHIDYNKQNCKEENLISLCKICHSKTNGNRDYWYTYYTYLMENR